MKSESTPKKNRRLNAAIFIFNLAAFLATIWIVVPAPSYYVWLFSIFASEWSFGFGVIALIGMICALAERFKTRRRFWILSFLCGAAALAISLYPFFSASQAARTQNVSLSFREYVSGFGGRDFKFNFSTRTFAEIDGNQLKADVYFPPAGIVKNGAAIIVVHGGSWNAGERSDFPQWNAWLAENGFVVFDVDYRLAPQPNWQTATGDVKCAVNWVQQNAVEFGILPDRIALTGRSAGGHLALLAAYSMGNSQLPSSCAGENPQKIRAVISFYSPTDLIRDFDHPANQAVLDGPGTISQFMGGSPGESEEMKNKYLIASPADYVTANTPPTLLIHGGHDQLVVTENMYLLAEKLKENRVMSQTIFISYAQHGFDYNFYGWGAQIVKPRILEFLRDNMK